MFSTAETRRDELAVPPVVAGTLAGFPGVVPVASIGEQARPVQDPTLLVIAHTEAPVQYNSNHHLGPSESLMEQRYVAMPYTNVGPAMISTIPSVDCICRFSDEDDDCVTLQFWLNEIWVKRDNYHWTDEQVARLTMEACKGCAWQTLEAVPSGEKTSLDSVVCALKQKFYSAVKQTTAKLLFNEHVHHHAKTERKFAAALGKLALYAYKDAPKYHIESRC